MYQTQPRFGAPAISTQGLLGQVLGITATGFLITAVTSYLTIGLGLPYGAGLIASLIGFGFLIAISGTRNNPGLSLLMFYLFTACEGVGIGPLLGTYIANFGTGIVTEAALTTGVGMLGLAAIVYLTSFDYRRLQGIAFGALLVLVLVGIVSIFVHFLHPGVFAWATLVIFSLLVLVDFGRIRAGGGGATAIELATSIYLDAINIFIALLEIFGMRRRSD
ncbi:MAG: Bax inhibitor-1/YccA family protein [Vulcanimicrobiaceae bacterium]